MQPYGWIWVNDEPWGWATYHHGRWFYDAGYWYWSPYGHYRPRRSWWYPALVVINIIHSDVYWYPASYYYSHRDCRWRYYQPRHNNNNWGGNSGPIRNPTPTPLPNTQPPVTAPIRTKIRGPEIPPTGVVTTKYDEFGTKKTRGVRPPLAVANNVIKMKTDDSPLPQLPVGSTIRTKMDREIISQSPASETRQSGIKVGATVRTTGALHSITKLRNTKVFGGRPLKVQGDMGGGVNNPQPTKSENVRHRCRCENSTD